MLCAPLCIQLAGHQKSLDTGKSPPGHDTAKKQYACKQHTPRLKLLQDIQLIVGATYPQAAKKERPYASGLPGTRRT
jgi:hypothetical protein